MPFACNFHSNMNIYITHKRILDVIDSRFVFMEWQVLNMEKP